ncbi:4Fe-4S dicluster domain-containing protein [Marinisporobacter balticus]|uniref:4Fe-4S dicluster protein n=1 Tax=Marinisporobacter balticus TaxID=2018667 RepID=A0A4V6NP85_9FIRM|nr:4Fe-4S dicluster domain-containing protein [Marinisporobacter balticus]TCO70020.1 4Fe-4S dicluster protein [Marinisporobacter balticus]
MKKILKSQISQLWKRINQSYELFIPIEKDNKVNFSMWQEGDQVNLEILKTNSSPKNIIFPQTETYLQFEKNGKKINMESVGGKKEAYVLFGVRPCDVVSFNLLDNVFLREPVDRFYEERRNKGIVISMACSDPEETCFCSAFGIDPENAVEGVDVATWDMGDKILWMAQTEKGKMFTQSLKDLLKEATEEDEEACVQLKNNIKEKVKNLPLSNIDMKKIDKSMKDLFESSIWEDFSAQCLGCGSCTYVCPTCHCYDIQDFDGGKSGERFRCWDSCMFSDFTLMAHGNPRKTQKERFRQRFMHKLVYYPNNHGTYACVGCGRCIERCPVHIDMVKVIKKLGGEL